jgi:hypothetical protein
MSTIIINSAIARDCTIGILQCGDFRCFTLELPWLRNASNVSCIPSGSYEYEKRLSPTLGWVIHIKDVEGRTWIYIHAGNFTHQIQGCVLVGDMIKDIDKDGIPDVGNSDATFKHLMKITAEKGKVIVTDSSRKL